MKSQSKVLIVEDEIPLKNVLVDKFKREGFIALSAIDGNEGLAVALKEHPEVILLDIVMPKMDGIEMLNKLRKDPWGKKVRVIILTNFDDEEKIVEAVENNVYEFLIKSDWKLDDIVKKVKEKVA